MKLLFGMFLILKFAIGDTLNGILYARSDGQLFDLVCLKAKPKISKFTIGACP